MKITLPETCTDPRDVEELRIASIPDTMLVVDATGVIRITTGYLNALHQKVINVCAPYYGHLVLILSRNDNDATRIMFNFASDMSGTTNSVQTAIEDECIGVCLTGSDLGLPYSDVAYPHPACPVHNE